MWLSSLKVGKRVGTSPALFHSHPLLGTQAGSLALYSKRWSILPLCCSNLFLQHLRQLWEIRYNLLLFTEIISCSFMEHLLCIVLSIYRLDYVVYRRETWFSTTYSHSYTSSRKDPPLKTKWQWHADDYVNISQAKAWPSECPSGTKWSGDEHILHTFLFELPAGTNIWQMTKKRKC